MDELIRSTVLMQNNFLLFPPRPVAIHSPRGISENRRKFRNIPSWRGNKEKRKPPREKTEAWRGVDNLKPYLLLVAAFLQLHPRITATVPRESSPAARSNHSRSEISRAASGTETRRNALLNYTGISG
ncbi:hypothetical protein CHN51_01445 [Sphingorhabdus sp. YGSMI21]|nr:hypothetical protein CHN51_01445 [Sphingorhabdus sp. YGSMI21]